MSKWNYIIFGNFENKSESIFEKLRLTLNSFTGIISSPYCLTQVQLGMPAGRSFFESNVLTSVSGFSFGAPLAVLVFVLFMRGYTVFELKYNALSTVRASNNSPKTPHEF